MLAQGRGGVAQLLRWSPELIAAQLDSAPYRTWLAATHAPGGAARVAWTNRAARLALWRQGFPEIAFAADSRTACRDARLVIGLKRLSRRMRRAAPGCGSQHHTPLHRLAERLAIAIEPAWLAPARLYGDVARMPLRRAAAGDAP